MSQEAKHCSTCGRTLVDIKDNPGIGSVCINFECSNVGGGQQEPAAPAPHDCGHCHECERELADGNSMMGRVCMSFYCRRFALTDEGETNPYRGPCPIEGGQ